jgi:hypothetical protein
MVEDYFGHLRRPSQSAFVKPAAEVMSSEKLKTLIEMEEIVVDKLERMSEDRVEGYRAGLKILGEMIQKGLNGSKSPA